jgi:hypothetical protein
MSVVPMSMREVNKRRAFGAMHKLVIGRINGDPPLGTWSCGLVGQRAAADEVT